MQQHKVSNSATITALYTATQTYMVTLWHDLRWKWINNGNRNAVNFNKWSSFKCKKVDMFSLNCVMQLLKIKRVTTKVGGAPISTTSFFLSAHWIILTTFVNFYLFFLHSKQKTLYGNFTILSYWMSKK